VHNQAHVQFGRIFLVVTANDYDTHCSTDTFDVNETALADDVITAS
jgi:hypothetical protein